MIWSARGIHTRYHIRPASTWYEVPPICIPHDILHHIMNSTDIRYEPDDTLLSGHLVYWYLLFEQLLHFRTVVRVRFRHRVVRFPPMVLSVDTSIPVRCTGICNQTAWVQHVTAGFQCLDAEGSQIPHVYLWLSHLVLWVRAAPRQGGVRKYGDRSHVLVTNSPCRWLTREQAWQRARCTRQGQWGKGLVDGLTGHSVLTASLLQG